MKLLCHNYKENTNSDSVTRNTPFANNTSQVIDLPYLPQTLPYNKLHNVTCYLGLGHNLPHSHPNNFLELKKWFELRNAMVMIWKLGDSGII